MPNSKTILAIIYNSRFNPMKKFTMIERGPEELDIELY